MATSKSAYHPTKQGPPTLKHRVLHVDSQENQDAYFAANRISAQINKKVLMRIAHDTNQSTNAGAVASVTDGADLFTIDADPAGNATEFIDAGFLMRTGANSGDDTVYRRLCAWTPAASKRVCARAYLKVDDVTKSGFFFGICASTTDPINTDASDLVAIRKAPTSASIIGRVNGNSGGAADSATLATMVNDTFIEIGFQFIIGSSAATSAGSFWINGTETAFTSAQLTALFGILTTPPSMYAILACRTGEAASHTITVSDALLEVDF